MTDRVSMLLRGRMLERFIGRALEEGVRFQEIERTGAREMTLCATEKNAVRLLALAEQFGMDLSVTGESGRPAFRKRMAGRRTLPLGLVLGFMLMTMFTSRIWCVEAVSLDGALDQTELDAICESAWALGAVPGRLRSDIDRDELAMRLYALCPELTHISVRTEGVFLRIEVAQEESAPDVYEIEKSRDLVAARDAVVVYIEPLAGRACVRAGDTVRRGQTLILGEERIDAEITRGIRALGKVTGRVWFTAEAGAQTTEVVSKRTGKKRISSQVRLGPWIWTLVSSEEFASQETETDLLPIGGLYLPLRIERTVLWETQKSSVLKDADALQEELTGRALEKARAQLPETAEETDCWVDFFEQNGILTARATVQAEMDIAAEREWMID